MSGIETHPEKFQEKQEKAVKFEEFVHQLRAEGKYFGNLLDGAAKISYEFVDDGIEAPENLQGDFKIADDLIGRFVPRSEWGKYKVDKEKHIVVPASEVSENHKGYDSVESYLENSGALL